MADIDPNGLSAESCNRTIENLYGICVPDPGNPTTKVVEGNSASGSEEIISEGADDIIGTILAVLF